MYDEICLLRRWRWWSTKHKILELSQLIQFINGLPELFPFYIFGKCKTLVF